MYKNKCNEPDFHEESFDYPFDRNSEGLEMIAVKMTNVTI